MGCSVSQSRAPITRAPNTCFTKGVSAGALLYFIFGAVHFRLKNGEQPLCFNEHPVAHPHFQEVVQCIAEKLAAGGE